MKKLSFAKVACIVLVLGAVSLTRSQAQTLTTLTTFDEANGWSPQAGLVQGLNGNLYGTTTFGGQGTHTYGNAFEISPAGELTVLHIFCSLANCADGANPEGLLLGADGNFYGLASIGGDNSTSTGTIFRMSPTGTITTLYSFCSVQPNCADGEYPNSLLQTPEGNFYGTTSGGGAYDFGSVFQFTAQGQFSTIYSFCSSRNGADCPDGREPAALILAANGNLFGATWKGGVGSTCASATYCGTLFEVTPAGTFTTLYTFCSKANCTDGQYPTALTLAANGNIYGTTLYGGKNCISSGGCGTVFEVTPAGLLTTLYNFCSHLNTQRYCTDGALPGPLLQANDGNFYGTTQNGTYGWGNVFEITPQGTLTTLYNFCAEYPECSDGNLPLSGVMQSTNGNFYGTTERGGGSPYCLLGCGTVFSLSVGLEPFVETVPSAGDVGAEVVILGNNLTGSTSVTFHGTAARYRVVSDTEIRARVPAGATSGTIQVVTPSGTLTSNPEFRVLP